ncbi:winged helix-turn-helix domain-containing protein [Streptomyces sp. 184]|uniref:winged helix-turn-helix domain-containing protein n=1 Tax=Streptomyces sp. 184 TaxID=1827526 RepID=UPI003892A07A
MTNSLSAPASGADAAGAVRHLRLVREPARYGEHTADGKPLVGYVVLVPPGLDPADLLADADAAPLHRAPHSAGPPDAPPDTGPVRLDVARRVAEVDGQPMDLTFLEFELLAHLVAHPRRVHSRESLVTTVWGYSHVGDGRTVDVHVARLRRKLGAAHRHRIVTVRRMGYKYEPIES